MNHTPDSSLTFGEVILRVAEESGWAKYDPNSADSPAAIPTERQLLDKLKRAVNDGATELARAYPKFAGLRPVLTLQLFPDGDGPDNLPSETYPNGDPSTYRLPWYVQSRPVGPWVWGIDGQTISGEAEDVSIDRVNRKHLSIRSSGFPVMAGVAPCDPPALAETQDGGSDRRTWKVRVWPNPQQAFFFRARFVVATPRMAQLTERHVFGAAHDQTLISFAMWHLKRHDARDPALVATYQQRKDEALAASIRYDQEFVPKTLGRLRDPAAERTEGRRYFHPGLDMHAGAASP